MTAGQSEPLLPDYTGGWIGAVLPAAAAALGASEIASAVTLPTADRVCVVLVDGLGERQLDATDSAPFLTQCPRRVLTAGVPTTTATSMGSFGTGLPPGQHGLVGYQVLDPDRGVLLNELRWHPDTDPLRWQPHPTVFEQLAAQGFSSLALGNPEFAGSGLTLAAHRGADFIGSKTLAQRVRTALKALHDPHGPRLIYLYWGQVDQVGHLKGVAGGSWRRAVAAMDRHLHRLATQAPPGSLIVLTSDHGMVDAADRDRIDLSDHPDLTDGVVLIGGEPRLVQLYCQPGAASAVAHRLAEFLGDRAWVSTRDHALAGGWFGPVGQIDERVIPRIGDVLVAARGNFTLVDSQSMHPSELGLVGYHGSLTPDELLVPLITLTHPADGA